MPFLLSVLEEWWKYRSMSRTSEGTLSVRGSRSTYRRIPCEITSRRDACCLAWIFTPWAAFLGIQALLLRNRHIWISMIRNWRGNTISLVRWIISIIADYRRFWPDNTGEEAFGPLFFFLFFVGASLNMLEQLVAEFDIWYSNEYEESVNT